MSQTIDLSTSFAFERTVLPWAGGRDKERQENQPFATLLRFISMPVVATSTTPSIIQRLAQVASATGWSNRQLASVLKTTHPTIKALLSGQFVGKRTPELIHRIIGLAELTERLGAIVGINNLLLTTALTTAPENQRESAVDLLWAGKPELSYLTALDIVNPPRRTGLMQSSWSSRAGEATVALDSRD